MFTESTSSVQRNLFDDILMLLPESKRKQALQSKDYAFYREVFKEIDESIFSVLFSKAAGRPNAPVNCMVGALVMRELKGWTYEQLFENLDYHMLTRLALGLTDMAESPFCPATLFNFQNRMVEYERQTGINLLDRVFSSLTARQRRRFAVDGSIQRSDSFRVMSNIANFGRLHLTVEVLRRVVRMLDEAEVARFRELVEPYAEKSSVNYVYQVADADIPRELETLGQVYAELAGELAERHGDTREWTVFERVLAEQFKLGDDGVLRPRDKSEITSGSLQSPDDVDATYNRKGGTPAKGFKVNVTETANPDNDINLITDIEVAPNNIGDGEMLAGRMEEIKSRTPELEELHTDGGYGGETMNAKTEEHKVLHVETGSQMGHAKVNMVYSPDGNGGYEVECPGRQTAAGVPTRKRWKAVFDGALCANCPHRESCPTTSPQHARTRTFYFEESWAKSSVRSRNIDKIPESRRKLRANVESTVRSCHRNRGPTGKLRIRGLIRTRIEMVCNAIAVNFNRIARAEHAGAAKNEENIAGYPVPSLFATVMDACSAAWSFFGLGCRHKKYHSIVSEIIPARRTA
jgi:hypothetical protein